MRLKEKPYWLQLIVLALFMLGGMLVFSSLGTLLVTLIYHTPNMMESADPVTAIRITQTLTTIGTFLVPALLFAYCQDRRWFGYNAADRIPKQSMVNMVLILSVTLLPVVGVLSALNQNIMPQEGAVAEFMRDSIGLCSSGDADNAVRLIRKPFKIVPCLREVKAVFTLAIDIRFKTITKALLGRGLAYVDENDHQIGPRILAIIAKCRPRCFVTFSCRKQRGRQAISCVMREQTVVNPHKAEVEHPAKTAVLQNFVRPRNLLFGESPTRKIPFADPLRC